MSQDLPFSAEYAKSGRSSCKSCGSLIPKDHIRIAKMVQSPHFDGKVALWNHFHCFFRKNKVKSTGDIKGFGTLRYGDQKKLKEKVGGLASTGSATVSVDVDVEYAKSSRSTCRGCFATIDKDTVRIGCWVDAEPDEMKWAVNGKKKAWHHPSCFVDRREELEIDTGITADMINGFKLLEKEDQVELVGYLGKGGGKKMKKKLKENIVPGPKTNRSFEKKLEAQDTYMMEIRQALKDVNNKQLRDMLENNGYPTHGADIKLIDRCMDGMAFGRFDESCPVCEGAYFSVGDNAYICRGDVSEFTKCTNLIPAPKRAVWFITDRVKEQSEFLANLKLKTGTRLFNVATPSSVAGGSAAVKILQDYVFYSTIDNIDIAGETHNVKHIIEKVGGGKVFKKFTARCNAIITDEINCNNKSMKRAISIETPVVECEKLIKGIINNSISDISTVCFTGYEGDDYVKKRRSIAELKSSSKRERSAGAASSVSKKAKITVQNGGVVFSETGLSGNKGIEVYKDLAGTIYAVTLGYVDIAKGVNSYYKMQILKRGNFKYELFRAWGRIGTDIGGTTFNPFQSPNGALEEFERLYTEKTGNIWGEKFVKRPGAFCRLDVDYGVADDDDESAIKPGSLTKLVPGIQDLVKLIFDINTMKQTLLEFEIDLNKMPLGKLSKTQIREAFQVLSAAQEWIEDVTANRVRITDATTKFFTLIPHDFGMASPPLLNNVDLINSKTKMLETLLELEIAYNMTRTDSKSDLDPIDLHFAKLQSDISVVNTDSDEYNMLDLYITSTHAKTHTDYTLSIINIFKVDRHGEDAKYQSFSTFHNRMLLWHGSRISNYAGILSQGLRIAPPEAPVTGYMFGKGVYFADMVSKSANYCYTTPANNTGLLLLCEVALGDMYELTDAKQIKKLPTGKHSTKGLGQTYPEGQRVLDNGSVMPLGPAVESEEISSLLYNEYIVYNTNQVRVKYLFQMKFNYSRGRRNR